jgi:hypothetical protein
MPYPIRSSNVSNQPYPDAYLSSSQTYSSEQRRATRPERSPPPPGKREPAFPNAIAAPSSPPPPIRHKPAVRVLSHVRSLLPADHQHQYTIVQPPNSPPTEYSIVSGGQAIESATKGWEHRQSLPEFSTPRRGPSQGLLGLSASHEDPEFSTPRQLFSQPSEGLLWSPGSHETPESSTSCQDPSLFSYPGQGLLRSSGFREGHESSTPRQELSHFSCPTRGLLGSSGFYEDPKAHPSQEVLGRRESFQLPDAFLAPSQGQPVVTNDTVLEDAEATLEDGERLKFPSVPYSITSQPWHQPPLTAAQMAKLPAAYQQ